MQGTFLVDQIYSTTAASVGGQSITFDFRWHYFSMHDSATTPNNVTSGITLDVGAAATLDVVFGHAFYYDTEITSITLTTVTRTTGSVQLYNDYITPTTFNVLQIDSVIAFVHTKTVTADMSFAIQMKVASGTNYSLS